MSDKFKANIEEQGDEKILKIQEEVSVPKNREKSSDINSKNIKTPSEEALNDETDEENIKETENENQENQDLERNAESDKESKEKQESDKSPEESKLQEDQESQENQESQDNSGSLKKRDRIDRPKTSENEEEGNSASQEKRNEEVENSESKELETIRKLDETKKSENITTRTEQLKKKADAVASIGLTTLKAIFNPITLIILAVGLLIIIIYSASSVLGQNDYNIMCSSDGIGVVSISEDADEFTRLSAITSWLTSTPFEKFGGKPMTREQALGVIGNIAQESYRGNPKAIQGDHAMTKWNETSNEDILAWGTTGGKAIGIIQWDGGRRVQLVNFAISEGADWYDFNTQLKFLKKELDGAEGQNLINGGFNDLTKTIADYVSIFNLKFERSELSGTEEGDRPRIQYAMDFASRYTDGSGLAMNCIGGSVNTSNLIQLAIASSYTAAERNSKAYGFGNCGSNLENCGQTFAKEEYKQANLIATEKTGADPQSGLLASCDRFVATMLRATGVDESFPWGATTQQAEYLDSSPDWQPVNCSDRQPGDVLIFKKNANVSNGHIMLYVGMVEGKDSIASASIAQNRQGRTAHISNVSCRGNLFNADGVDSQGYRKVN